MKNYKKALVTLVAVTHTHGLLVNERENKYIDNR